MCVCVWGAKKDGSNRGYSVQMPSRRGMMRTIQSDRRTLGRMESSQVSMGGNQRGYE